VDTTVVELLLEGLESLLQASVALERALGVLWGRREIVDLLVYAVHDVGLLTHPTLGADDSIETITGVVLDAESLLNVAFAELVSSEL